MLENQSSSCSKSPPPIGLDTVVRMARRFLLEHGQHDPMVVVDGTNQTILVLVSEFPASVEARVRLMYKIGEDTAKESDAGRVRRVFFISEGWLSRAPIDEAPFVRPAEDPNRVEVLVISGFDMHTQETYIEVLELIRSDDQQLTDVVPYKEEEQRESVQSVPLDAFLEGYKTVKD